MIASDLETGVRKLREMLDTAEVVVPFTGDLLAYDGSIGE